MPLLGIADEMNYNPTVDCLVIGSDEVFNCIQKNSNVGYSPELFGKNNHAKKLITYAASFGNTTLEKLEKYKKANQKKYSKQFRDINTQIEGLIKAAKTEGSMSQEIAILEAIKRGFPARKAAAGATAEFFRLNERKLEALIKATTQDMQKAETAVLRMANDQYRKAIFNAQVYANSGAGTYEKAVDMATRDMLSRSLNCVEYANGARHTLADYADMAIRTASKRAYLQGEGEKRQEWGLATVIMNKRGNPCPKCLPFVGKVLIDDVWSGGKKVDGPYPLMSTAIAAGLYHPRCKDSHTTYFPRNLHGRRYLDKRGTGGH